MLNKDKTCSVPGCDRPVLAKGLCKRCYDRLRSKGTTDYTYGKYKKCTIEGCDGDHYGHGLCQRHWAHLYNYGNANDHTRYRKKAGARKCSLDWCDRDHFALGYCRRHYRQLKTRGSIIDESTIEGENTVSVA